MPRDCRPWRQPLVFGGIASGAGPRPPAPSSWSVFFADMGKGSCEVSDGSPTTQPSITVDLAFARSPLSNVTSVSCPTVAKATR
jgi:hypothetical protein